MGLTVGCAVCHDHKYDPITQRDFYQLYAFFNNIESPPETPGRGVHPPFLRLATSEQQQQMQKFDEQVAALENELTKANQSDAKETEVQAIEQRIQQAKSSRKQLEDTIPVTLIMKERDDVRPTHPTPR